MFDLGFKLAAKEDPTAEIHIHISCRLAAPSEP
jgi:hypothetical protein